MDWPIRLCRKKIKDQGMNRVKKSPLHPIRADSGELWLPCHSILHYKRCFRRGFPTWLNVAPQNSWQTNLVKELSWLQLSFLYKMAARCWSNLFPISIYSFSFAIYIMITPPMIMMRWTEKANPLPMLVKKLSGFNVRPTKERKMDKNPTMKNTNPRICI